jgi:mRNA-degrading endonuclease RelE of RelBE toxin-antitoxin system
MHCVGRMPWTVTLRESVIDDLRHFGRKTARLILKEARKQLAAGPLEETRQMKTLRPNRVAQRELRLFGKYRALFNADDATHSVDVVLVGEQRGEALVVQAKEFVAHHESDSTQ